MIQDRNAIADALLTAPSWALVALTVPQARLRDHAREEIADHLIRTLGEAARARECQLRLPLG